MTADNGIEPGESTGNGPVGDRAGGCSRGTPAGSWLLMHKVELPDAVVGYVERPQLEDRCSPVSRRLTVLHAPGGFGKTALMGRCCQRLREEGVTVAWFSVDEDDDALSVASYLSLAFEQAGMSVFQEGPGDAQEDRAYASEAPDSAAIYRIELLLRAIRSHKRPCVLAVDELDRLQNPEAVLLINAVLDRAPRNLHYALAFRERPNGLNVATLTLEGHGETLTAEDLRFTPEQIARFLDMRLTRAQLTSIANESAGWPIALRLYRNAQEDAAGISDLGKSDTVAAWIETRLWRGLSAEDREFVLELALFDWIDATLVDEATGRQQSKRRLGGMASLNGLLQSVGKDGGAMRLHPLIREYCADKLFREDRNRFCSIHAGIAQALAKRGQVLDALRHASEAGDSEMIGAIAEQAGGVKLWIRRGTDALRSLDGWLTQGVLAARPRLALVRCVALMLSGDMEEARRVYYQASVESVGFTRGGPGQEDEELQTDHLLVLGGFAILGCGLLARYDRLLAESAELTRRPNLDPLLRGMINLGTSIAHSEKAEFDEGVGCVESASADLSPTAPFLLPQIDFQLGIIAMARGSTHEAERRYERGMNVAQGHVGDTGTLMIGGALKAELELERCAGTPRLGSTFVSARLLGEYSAWSDAYAASIGVAAELAWYYGSRDSAMAGVEQAREYARATDRTALVRLWSAQRVSLLVARGRSDEAARVWSADQLPESTEACLDLKEQRWREMEAIASARVRLLTARGDKESARDLARGLREVALNRSLIRTLMRALALSARLEVEAGDEDAATAHLIDALRLFECSDYARPLAREKAAVIPLLERVVASAEDQAILRTAQKLRTALTDQEESVRSGALQLLSVKEREVLRRLDTHTDKEIARALGMSYEAVRYYVRKLFAKVSARNRYDTVHRARAMGLLPSREADETLRN